MSYLCQAFRPRRFGWDSIAWRILQSEDNYRSSVSFASWTCILCDVLVMVMITIAISLLTRSSCAPRQSPEIRSI